MQYVVENLPVALILNSENYIMISRKWHIYVREVSRVARFLRKNGMDRMKPANLNFRKDKTRGNARYVHPPVFFFAENIRITVTVGGIRTRFITDSLDTHLDDLLARICVKLEITSTQRAMAKKSYDRVGTWLGDTGSPLVTMQPNIYAQGSLNLDTTVKPRGQDEFDLDVVCEFLAPDHTKDAVTILKLIEQRLRAHGTYATMIEPKDRCIRLNYTGEFHLDVVPAYPDRVTDQTAIKIPDKKTHAWRPSNPKGYATWFDKMARNIVFLEKAANMEPFPDYDLPQDKPALKQIVQLMKRHRDVKFDGKKNESPVSVVLTTLAGHTYRGEFSVNRGLGEVLSGVSAMVAAVPPGQRLKVMNPSNIAEDLSEKWVAYPDHYRIFKNWLNDFRKEWAELQATRGLPNVVKLLGSMFDESVVNIALTEQQQYLEKARQSGTLGVKSSGIMITGAAPGVISVKKNTFFGQ